MGALIVEVGNPSGNLGSRIIEIENSVSFKNSSRMQPLKLRLSWPSLVLLQHHNDLLFRKSRTLHPSVLHQAGL
jgi:hypothetical protein